MPLRHKLFLILGLMSLVPLLILQFGVLGRIEKDLEFRIEAEIQGKLNKMAEELDTLIESQKALSAGLAEAPIIRRFSQISANQDAEQYNDTADNVQEYFIKFQQRVGNIQALRYIDNKGKTLVKVKEGKLIEPQLLDDGQNRYFVADQSKRPFYRSAITNAANGVYVSDFELGQVQKNADFCPAMMRYSVPVRNGLSEIEGLLVVNMWGTRIDETVLASIGGFEGKVYVVEINDRHETRDGIYLYHDDSNNRFANQLGSSIRFSSDIGLPLWRKIRDENAAGYKILDDGRMIFYNTYSPYDDKRSNWMLVIETSYDTVFAPVQQIRLWIWVLLITLLVLSLFIAKWAAARLAGPVQELADTITHYADGEDASRYSDCGRSDEVGIVGRAFNYLCETLDRTRIERDEAESSARHSERLAAVGQMAAGIGHEINNPLMNIMSLATLIESSVDEYDKNQMVCDLKTLQQEGQRCARIVQGILKFARASEPSYDTFRIDELLADTIDLLKHRADAKSVKIKRNFASEVKLKADYNQLQQVFVNVILNAIHASSEGSEILISVRDNVASAIIDVIDHGHGIAKSELSRVFNPFFSTKPEGEGTGLGLSVSYGIVEKHAGLIQLNSELGKGTQVHIELPTGEVGRIDTKKNSDMQAPKKLASGE